ncbi:unnamed protein product [Caenorhabditis brenneri]
MTEKGADATMDVDQATSGVHKGSPSNFTSFNQALTSQRIENKMDEMLKELKSVKTQFGDQQKVLETLQDRLQGLKPQKTSIEESTPQMSDEKKQEKVDSLVSKQFVLKHIFKNISSHEVRNIKSETEEHFGVKWYIVVSRLNGDLACYLHCRGHEIEKDWKIETEFEIKTYDSNNKVYSEKVTFCYSGAGGYGFPDFLERDEIEKNYSIENGLKVEVHVKIKSTTGIYKEDLRKFDDSMQDVSDITLIVNDKKFYVSKLYLAAHSSYFKAMFLGMFGESKKSEITLTGMDPSDFQKYLEVLYGHNAVDESTVEGILLVADMYDTQIVVQKCEEFLVKKSKKSLKKKLLMSVRYNLGKLKNRCLTHIKTADDIRSIMPSDSRDLEPSLATILLQKSLSFQ